MLVLNYKQFVDKLKKNDSKFIRFFDGHEPVKDSAGNLRNHFDKLSSTSTDTLLKEVKAFADLYPAKFSAYAFTTDKAITTNGDLLHIDLSQRENKVAAPAAQVDEAAIIARVTKQITDQAEANLTKQKLELAEARLAQLDNASERIALIGLKFADLFANGSPVMQGSEDEPEGDAKSEMSIKDAIHLLRTSFGDKTLIKLAQDPKSIEKLKLFL